MLLFLSRGKAPSPPPPPVYVTEGTSVFVGTGQQLRVTQVWHSDRVGTGLYAALIKSRLDQDWGGRCYLSSRLSLSSGPRHGEVDMAPILMYMFCRFFVALSARIEC